MPKKILEIEHVGEVLDKSLKRLDLAPRLDEYGVWPVWNEVVGPPIARNAQPEKIRNGTLFVKVSSSVWMQQLQFMKELITDKLNERLGAPIVKNIFFVVGKIDVEGVESETPATPRPAVELPTVEIDESFLQALPDPAMRQAFKRLLLSHRRRKRRN